MNDIINNGNKVSLYDLDLPGDLRKLNISQCKGLCSEIRTLLIHTVSKTGGHLSSNLGVVELTMAIHRNFNSPEDKIVWDVGHQAYVHKILTGRADRFSTLRQKDGISGFPKPCESEHDTCISGHSSNSVSVACGIAEAMKLQGKDNYTVAVIGDGAMTGGMFYEAMNNAGKESVSNLIVILNDNEMSISRNVGSLAKYLTELRNTEKYLDTKRKVERNINKLPAVGNKMAKGIKRFKDVVKSTVLQTTIFEDMGFVYLGPINGHEMEDLDEAMRMAKKIHAPVFIHVQTKKGKGYLPAEANPGEYHGISRFDIETGNPEVSAKDSYSSEFGKKLRELGEMDSSICAITAAMKYGTGLQYFAQKFPDRFFDVGIAEQHAVTFAGGLASMGMIPVFAVYSSFLQRAYDQLVHDIAIGGLHLVLGIDRAGIVGEDGETHQGLLDIPMLTTIPGTVIYSPCGYEEMKMCLNRAVFEDTGLVAVRYPRGSEDTQCSSVTLTTEHIIITSGGSRILLISYGRCFGEVCKAQRILGSKGIVCDVMKLTRIFPLAEEIISEINGYDTIVFFEEAMSCGSISEKLGELLEENGYTADYSRVAIHEFVKQASVRECLDHLGLTGEKMAEYVEKRIKADGKT